MDRRQKLSKALKEVTGLSKIYYAPETNTNMEYPCIRYELTDRVFENANNKKYIGNTVYTVIYISRKPDTNSVICDAIESLDYTQFERCYVANGLYHYVYTITI